MPNLSYKKTRKQEKNKKKLKTALKNVKTKTVLPKGQNLTDTNFKVKKIVIKDQVRPHERDEILYQKKLNVNELTVRLAHHNSSIKHEALDGLKELVTKYAIEDLGMPHIQILQAVIKLAMDETASIRKSSCKILGRLLSLINPAKLAPFLESLNSYLLCGLTHIERGIREDSLALLDICLKHVPQMCRKHAWHLLAVCLDLISVKNVGSRTLSLNLDSSVVVTKWRIGVLERVHSLVNLLLENSKEANFDSGESVESRYVTKGQNHFPIYDICSRSNEICPVNVDIDEEPEHEKRKENAFAFLGNVFPLVMDMFLEVFPVDRKTNDSSTILSEENCHLLGLAVGIIQSLWELTEDASDQLMKLRRKFTPPLLKTLVHERFPFCCPTQARNNESVGRTVNLSVARLTLTITSPEHWTPVIPFLKNSFRTENALSPQDIVTFTDCVSRICLQLEHPDSEYFLSKVVSFSQGKSQLKPYFFKLLGRIALDTKMKKSHELEDFKIWLASLPEKLVDRPVAPYQMKIISEISLRSFLPFSQSLDNNIELILDGIPRVYVKDEEKRELVQWQMATLLHCVKEWDSELVDSLQPAIDNCYWGERLTAYISDIISMKSVK